MVCWDNKKYAASWIYFFIDVMVIKKYRQLHLSNAAGIKLQEHIVQKHHNNDTSRVICSNRWKADFEYHVAREGWAAVCKNYNACSTRRF